MNHSYTYLNQPVAPGTNGYSDAWARVLSRLGEYTGLIIQSLKMRPREVKLLEKTARHVLLRMSDPAEHLVLRIAPEGDLVREVFFARTMQHHHLPAVRLAHYDLKRTLVPFDYTLERHIGGLTAEHLHPAEVPHLLYGVARQTGRTLRQMHRLRVPGWGNPAASGRWLIPDWLTVLTDMHERLAPPTTADNIFSDEEQTALRCLLHHSWLHEPDYVQPCLLHGAMGPQAVRCTVGDHVQLAGLIEPGAVVGGDGLLDLAWGLDPAYPAEWCRGLLAGYTSTIALSLVEQERLRMLRLLTCYWSACQRYARAEPHAAACQQSRALLQTYWQQV